MSTHRNADYNLKRNDLIKAAYRKLNVLQDGQMDSNQLLIGVEVLNLILREEDLRNTGQAKALWALKDRALQLQASKYIYTPDDGLASDIQDIVAMSFRNTSGDDSAVTLINSTQYQGLIDKNETGDVTKAYLLLAETPDLQKLFVWPMKTSVGTTSEVVGSDGENYICIMGHTSAANTQPTSGSDWPLYWDQQGSSGSTWVTATAYTNGEMLTYTYKRPLFDFDNATDNPDMPRGWTRYLLYRLAYDLSPEYAIQLEERDFLRQNYLVAREEIFPSTRSQINDPHNKSLYY